MGDLDQPLACLERLCRGQVRGLGRVEDRYRDLGQLLLSLKSGGRVLTRDPKGESLLRTNFRDNVELKCAVERRVFLVGANPTQRLSLPLVAARAIHGGNDMG